MLMDKDIYEDTLKILRGEIKLAPVYCEMRDWIKSRFGANACNFCFREEEDYFSHERRFRLYIVFLLKKDYAGMFSWGNYDSNKKSEIAQKFIELADKYGIEHSEQAKNADIHYNDFASEVNIPMKVFNHRAIVHALMQKYEQHFVRDIESTVRGAVVFYRSEEDKRRNAESGISGMIRSDYLEELKKYDEFGTIDYDTFAVGFDSMEILDGSYDGNINAYKEDRGL